jgi:hypothetical protein
MLSARAAVALAVGVAGAVVVGAGVQVGAAVGSGVLADHRLREAREDDAARVVAATARDDCPAAVAAYRAATTGPALPWRRPPIPEDVTRAATDCRDLARLDALAAAGRRAEALRGYLEFRGDHGRSPLYRYVPDRIGNVLRAGRLAPDTKTCGLAAELVARDDWPAPADTMPGLLASCGELLAAASRDDFDKERNWAAVLLRALRRYYGGSPEASRTEATEAALLMRESARTLDLQPPWRVRGGSAGSGRVQVVYMNYTRGTMTFAISGRGGGRVVEVPACADCPRLDEGDDCTRKGNTTVVTLPAGTYRVWVTIEYPGRSYEWRATWRLKTGAYADCLADWK